MFLMPFSALLMFNAFSPSRVYQVTNDYKPLKTTNTTLAQYDAYTDCENASYMDVDGLVIIEAEQLIIDGTNWNIKTDFEGYTGAGYLSWDGNNNFNSPGNGLLSTQIKINTPGTYRFRWHSKVGNGDNSTEHNDSWLRFPDASNFYGEKNGQRVYPVGSGQTPHPQGSSSDGWFKIYLSGTTNWTWSTQTSDNDAHQIYVEFDTADIYTMEISGRSKDHLIDRITLSNNATDPLNLNNEETLCDEALSIANVTGTSSKKSIRIFPNPTEDIIFIQTDDQTNNSTVSIFDYKGMEIIKTRIDKITNRLDISQLAAGIYFVISNEGHKTRFIKK